MNSSDHQDGVADSRRVARVVTRYASCTVDPRPGRAVHYPDLNACLVNEGRPDPVDCNAVHFGYAIPVSVVPLPEEPDLAELVLEPSPDLSPEAVTYLLRHHPQYRQERDLNGSMAATHDIRGASRAGKFASEPEEDIAAIAKQISDHAEAIYQTWKSRGLAPAEILTCHSSATAADKFGSALTPTPSTSSSSSPKAAPVTMDLSLDANNLERLVNNFVVEDKARLAARQQQKSSPAKTLPSSIQIALQKFEKTKPAGGTSPEPKTSTPSFTKPEIKSSYLSPRTTVPQNVVPIDNIASTFPNDTSNTSSGLTTWPLKNKAVTTKTSEAVNTRKTESTTSPSKYATMPSNNSSSSKDPVAYLDEVAREEERLINALKTGIIIAEDPTAKDINASPNKKLSTEKKTTSRGLSKKTSTTTDNKTTITTTKKEAPKTATAIADPKATSSASQVRKASPVISTTTTALSRATPSTSPVASKPSSPERVLKEKDKTTLSNLSVVDYAKVRYRAAQQSPLTQKRLEDAKLLDQQHPQPRGLHLHTEVIPVARNRFQLGPRSPPGGTGGHPPVDPHPHKEAVSLRSITNPTAAGGVNPVRPFLTRGSVAERVLIFEKCPSELLLDKRGRSAPAITTWRSGHEVHSKAQNYSSRDVTQRILPPNTTLQRHVKANRNVHIPRFYYPTGKPTSEHAEEVLIQKISAAFQQFPNQQVPRDKFATITKAAKCPLYWKVPLFIAAGGEKLGYVETNTFIEFWKKMTAKCHDQASRFIYILTRDTREGLVPDDFIPLVQDVVDTHPGLTFLKEATEFHSRYVHTVIARIFYNVNRSWSGRISLTELRRSNLLRVIQLLEEEEDINQVTAYFSYEHFYVIYCKFWELDRDHDLYIDRQDLTRHSDHALSTRMIDRIFSGAVTRGTRQRLQEDKMSYTEFVWFLLAEEDKTHPTAIEYWFRCMDLDGDGYLSMYELEYFYEEQLQRMEAIGIETLPFEDCLCQMLDMIQPAEKDKISLGDLKRCKMTPIFFDTFFNLEKYLDHEQRDPFASQRDHDSDGQELSDWDRYAAEEYELLVAEEGNNEQQDEVLYDDDTDVEDALSPNLDQLVVNHNNTAAETGAIGNMEWKKPSFTVTDFDMDDDDYAADSDDCSV